MGDVAIAVGEIEQALASVKDDASSRAAQQKMKAIQPRLAQAVQTVVDLQGKGAVPADTAKFQADSTRVTSRCRILGRDAPPHRDSRRHGFSSGRLGEGVQ